VRNGTSEDSGLVRRKTDDTVGTGDVWKKGFWERFPWLGVTCLLFVLLCLIFNIIILCVSDGMDVDNWGVQPQVLIAVSAAISHGCLRVAVMQGGMITWWRTAMSGSTIKNLAILWDLYNENPFICFRKFHVLALAAIAVMVVPVDSPLYQRSQTVETRDNSVAETLPVKIAQQIPSGYTGYMMPVQDTVASIKSSFRDAYEGYANKSPMLIDVPGHKNANFTANVRAAGLKVKCSQTSVDTAFGDVYKYGNASYTMDNQTEYKGSSVNAPKIIHPNVDAFKTEFNFTNSWPSFINLTSKWKNGGDCYGPLQVRTCSFQLATVIYPIEVKNGEASFSQSLSNIGLDSDTVVRTYLIRSHASAGTPIYYETDDSTLGGLYLMAKELFTSTAHITKGGDFGTGYDVAVNGTLAQDSSDNIGNVTSSYADSNNGCNVTFTDPTSEIINGMQELMFRTSLRAANETSTQKFNGKNVSMKQKAKAQVEKDVAIFKLHPGFLGAAAAVSFVCLLPVAACFWGFWQLGQRPTMNPIALSHAFGSPIVVNVPGSPDPRMVKVRYGPNAADDFSEGKSDEESEGNMLRQRSIKPRFTHIEQ
ncbi:hypothetical protein KEM55_007678, partial [Ascosphaera atra]